MVNFICLKWGDKYDASFVNRMYTMINRNCKVPFILHCCTENPRDIIDIVNIIPLPEHYCLETFWWKLWITSNEFPIKDKCIFLDLDTVIQNDLSDLIEYSPEDKLAILETRWRHIGRFDHMTHTNSSIIVWDSNKRDDIIFDTFIKSSDRIMLKYPGNDDYTEQNFPELCITLPHEWFYCRVWGYDDSDDNRYRYQLDPYHDLWGVDLVLYRMPERMICMFNGIREGEGIDSRIYQGFEHYWED